MGRVSEIWEGFVEHSRAASLLHCYILHCSEDAANLGVAEENCRLCGARIQTYLLEKAKSESCQWPKMWCARINTYQKCIKMWQTRSNHCPKRDWKIERESPMAQYAQCAQKTLPNLLYDYSDAIFSKRISSLVISLVYQAHSKEWHKPGPRVWSTRRRKELPSLLWGRQPGHQWISCSSIGHIGQACAAAALASDCNYSPDAKEDKDR